MKKSIQIIPFFFVLTIICSGQQNYIFNGGLGQGFTYAFMEVKSNNSIFQGSGEDGFDKTSYASVTGNWNGGIEDGFGYKHIDSQPINSIFYGSLDDGMAYMTYVMDSNNDFFYGGEEDGFSYGMLEGISNNLVYSGGEGDGFSASGISKLIWDGDLSSDWLMADNWNIPIVPTMNHAVCIPDGVPHFPKLSATLGLSIDEEHTYASSDVLIMAGAKITGVKNMNIIVDGNLIVAGDLLIFSQAPVPVEGKSGGVIRVETGGVIRVE